LKSENTMLLNTIDDALENKLKKIL